jgi:hypothetical protein
MEANKVERAGPAMPVRADVWRIQAALTCEQRDSQTNLQTKGNSCENRTPSKFPQSKEQAWDSRQRTGFGANGIRHRACGLIGACLISALPRMQVVVSPNQIVGTLRNFPTPTPMCWRS